MRAVSLLLLIVLSIGCVSKAAHQDLEREKLQLEHELRIAEVERQTLRAQLNLQQVKAMESLKTKLAACQERVAATRELGERLAKEAEEKGFYQGVADFHRSLQIVGIPSSDGWWIFANHYYTFEVHVAGQPLYSMKIESEDEVPSVSDGLALVTGVQGLVQYRSKL